MDEAQDADAVLMSKLISPSLVLTQKSRNPPSFLDKYAHVELEYRRGFLTVLSAALDRLIFQKTWLLAGTELSLANAERVGSSVGKPELIDKITEYPQASEDDVLSRLDALIDLSGCSIPQEQLQLLSGRNRLHMKVIEALISQDNGMLQEPK